MSDPLASERPAAPDPPEPAGGWAPLSFAGFVFDPARQELSRAGAVIALAPKSLALLTYFLAHPRRVLPKDELIRATWGPVVVTDDSLVQCVKDLRLALGDKEQRLIRTLPRRGYMFDVQPLPLALAAPATAQAPAASPAGAAPPPPPPRRRRAWLLAGTLGLALLGLLAGAFVQRDEPAAAPVDLDEQIQNRRALAVLAFTDARGKAAGATLGNDLADAVGARLVRDGARVIGRAATVLHDPGAPEFERIGREQGVRYVIGGRVHRERDAILVDSYLTEIATGAVYRLHEASFQHDDEAGQSKFSQDVAAALRARLYEIETTRARQSGRDDDPVDAIVLGWRDLDLGNTPADAAHAQRRFALAAQADPESVEASTGLGYAYLAEFYAFYSPAPEATLQRAEQAFKRAIDRAPDSPQALSAWADMLLLRRQPEAAIWLWQKALALNPDYQTARLRLAHGLIRQGRYDEAAQQLALVTDLRPYQMRRQQALYQTRADLAFAQGRDDEAYQVLTRWAAESPNSGRPYLMLAAIDALHQRDTQAAAHMQRYRQLLPHGNAAYVALTYPSSNPTFVAQRTRLLDGARQAGLPESGP